MKNAMLPESELKILGEIFEKITELVDNHEKSPLSMKALHESSEAEQLHIVMYMDILKDMITSAKSLQGLLEISEEEFIKAVTEDGKISMREVKRKMMMNMLIDMM